MRYCWIRYLRNEYCDEFIAALKRKYGRSFIFFKNRRNRPYPEADVYMTWASPLNGRNNPYFRRKSHERLAAHCKKKNRPLIIVERGIFDRFQYFTISINDINGFGDYSYVDMDPVRPKFRLPPIKPMDPTRPGYVVFPLQVPDDGQLDVGDYYVWVDNTLNTISKIIPRSDIRVRFHPQHGDEHRERFKQICDKYGMPWHLPEDVPIDDLMAGARVTVAYNSGFLIDSLLRGVPIVCLGEGSFVRHLACHTLQGIRMPRYVTVAEVERALTPLTHTQFSRDEMRTLRNMEFLDRPIRRPPAIRPSGP